jgi:hypothetical protein
MVVHSMSMAEQVLLQLAMNQPCHEASADGLLSVAVLQPPCSCRRGSFDTTITMGSSFVVAPAGCAPNTIGQLWPCSLNMGDSAELTRAT